MFHFPLIFVFQALGLCPNTTMFADLVCNTSGIFPTCDAGLVCNSTSNELVSFAPLSFAAGTFPTELALFPLLTSMYALLTTHISFTQIHSTLASKGLTGTIPDLSALAALQYM
jgi:hypothetical protein